MTFTRHTPGALEARTAAALLTDGRNASPYVVRGIRVAAASSLEQCWQGPTAFPTLPAAPSTLTAVSDTAGDTAGGVGARSLAIVYLNRSGECRLATGDMAGLAPASMFEFDQVTQTQTGVVVVDATRVLSVTVRAVGSGLVNAGIIDVSIGADIQARIPRNVPVVSQTMMNFAQPGAFTVPAGFCALLDSVNYRGGQPMATQVRPARLPWIGLTGAPVGAGTYHRCPRVLAAGTDVRLVYESPGPVAVNDYLQPELSLYLHPDTQTKDSNPEQIPKLARCGLGIP